MRLVFVLVEPKVPENVGAAARALKTMGFADLWLVGNERHLEPQARWLAHGSEDILDGVRCFPDLASVRAHTELMIGTSAKPRHRQDEWLLPGDLKQTLAGKTSSTGTVALVFGREDRGLSNDELAQCDLLTGLPLKTTYPSLNLAQAVMVYAWELADMPRETATSPEADSGNWRSLQTRLTSLLPQLDTPLDGKLAQLLLQKLPRLPNRELGLLHTLAGNIEQVLERKKR
ncbi:tRNA/rRNA methyltransferase [Marinobacter zhejiangensis]|uniref:tRNA (cytidine/uridine-2'-O-)-methyltransferase TrmJ n=1 Tax=Marinobacter zhejiangensis TaxID=488535 RepID=A0A1I4Q3U5_9GAMM|nr:tRNA/rRNA methyltransferase [Marinobacter zhejiangensis]SFM34704.1 tRNA/rRNA methyltransferase [Marinobacter zhejiangensis]